MTRLVSVDRDLRKLLARRPFPLLAPTHGSWIGEVGFETFAHVLDDELGAQPHARG